MYAMGLETTAYPHGGSLPGFAGHRRWPHPYRVGCILNDSHSDFIYFPTCLHDWVEGIKPGSIPMVQQSRRLATLQELPQTGHDISLALACAMFIDFIPLSVHLGCVPQKSIEMSHVIATQRGPPIIIEWAGVWVNIVKFEVDHLWPLAQAVTDIIRDAMVSFLVVRMDSNGLSRRWLRGHGGCHVGGAMEELSRAAEGWLCGCQHPAASWSYWPEAWCHVACELTLGDDRFWYI